MTANVHGNDKFTIRDGMLLANGEAIRVDNIIWVSEQKSTRPTDGSNKAFVAMLTSAAVGAICVYFIPPVGALAFVISALGWFLAWSLRAPCWSVIAHESAKRQCVVQFNEATDAERLVEALSLASSGRLLIKRSALSETQRRRVAHARGMRPLSIAIIFLGGAIIYGVGTSSNTNQAPPNQAQGVGGAIMIMSGIAFIVEWAISTAAARPKKIPPRDVCAACGYSLIGNVSGVCPECGTKIADR